MEQVHIPQLRISVSSACGKHCLYCRPGGESFRIQRKEMTSQQVVDAVRILVRHGITDLKLTGGDPMLRRDIVDLVAQLKRLPGVKNVHLVTRHSRAGDLAGELKEAGLDCLNFSLDSLNPATWSYITRATGHAELVQAIVKAAKTGINLKINTVMIAGINDREIPDMIEFAGKLGATLKLLDLIVDLDPFADTEKEFCARHYYDLTPILPVLSSQAAQTKMDLNYQPGGLGHPMPSFLMKNGATVLVKTSHTGAWYTEACAACSHYPCHDAIMALRLSADGKLQRCLLREDNLVDLIGMLNDQMPTDQVDAAIKRVLADYTSARFHEYEELQAIRREKHHILYPAETSAVGDRAYP